jgi:hypothetical protein
MRALSDTEIRWQVEGSDRDAVDDLLTEVILDAHSYRVLAQEALHALHRLTTQHKRMREQLCDALTLPYSDCL